MSAAFTYIPGHPCYAASRDGRILSVTSNWRGYGARELVPDLDRYGYPTVRLTEASGKRRRLKVHRLVAATFLGPRPEGAQIRHLDGDPTNNRVENLAYGTAAENAADRTAHGRAAPITPEKREKMRAGFRRWWLERNVDA